MKDILTVFFVSMLPVSELRGAIPVGAGLGLRPVVNYITAVTGNMLPVPFVVLFIRQAFGWLQTKSRFLNRLINKRVTRTLRRHRVDDRRSELLALVVLVAIPLPGTGAWTGAILAAFLQIRLKTAVPAIGLGVLIAGAVVSFITYGVKIALF
jgi:uncharacterized membrane protein